MRCKLTGRSITSTRWAISPSPGTPAFGSEAQARRGEGRGEGDFEVRTALENPNNPHPNPLPWVHGRGDNARLGFTLIEVLVTLMMMTILIPVIMKGIATSTAA